MDEPAGELGTEEVGEEDPEELRGDCTCSTDGEKSRAVGGE